MDKYLTKHSVAQNTSGRMIGSLVNSDLGKNVEVGGLCFSCVNIPTFSREGLNKTMETSVSIVGVRDKTSVRIVGVRDKNHGRHKSEHKDGVGGGETEILSATCITT